MAEHERRYRCPVCGYVHTVKWPEIAGNRTVRRMWHDGTELDQYWPPFMLCGKCYENGARGGSEPTPRMWPMPDIDNGELAVKHVCKMPKCEFSSEMPRSFPDGWKCPKCRFGVMRRKRW